MTRNGNFDLISTKKLLLEPKDSLTCFSANVLDENIAIVDCQSNETGVLIDKFYVLRNQDEVEVKEHFIQSVLGGSAGTLFINADRKTGVLKID